jgi:hypothetical protein
MLYFAAFPANHFFLHSIDTIHNGHIQHNLQIHSYSPEFTKQGSQGKTLRQYRFNAPAAGKY